MNDLHISFYQQDIVWGDAEANRRQVEAKMSGISDTDIFVVPETFTTGFGDHMAALAEEPMGPTLRWAQQMAAKYDFLFVGTWIVREGGRCYNRLHWVYPDGRFGYYDKAHTFRVSGEADQIARGIR
ncbi:MAG: nitrilase family protein, partial [Bacteroidales bacterium]|nr:nitrilase family protein [Bacteroidales bacterium]